MSGLDNPRGLTYAGGGEHGDDHGHGWALYGIGEVIRIGLGR
jgi:hypothetical protein